MSEELDLNILKTLVTDKRAAIDFSYENDEKLFSTNYWLFAKCVIDYIKVYKEIPTKRTIIEKNVKNKEDPKYKYISEIWEKVNSHSYDVKEFKHDLQALKNRFAASVLSSLNNDISTEADVLKAIKKTEASVQKIKAVYTTKKYGQKTLKDSISDFRQRYSAKQSNPEFGRGILTGYNFLDKVINGFRPGEMFLVGGETGAGKSLILMNMAIQMWIQGNSINRKEHFAKGYNIVYFSLEMPFDDCLERLLARLAMIPQKKIRDANLDDDELLRLRAAIQFIEAYPYNFEIIDMPRGATAESIETILNDIKTRYNPDVIAIDYLALMEFSGETLDDWLKLGKISEKLHEMGRVNSLVVLSAFQLTDIKRSGKGKDPGMAVGRHRVARSSQILDNTNFACMLNKRDNEEQFPDMQIVMIKSRRTELTSGNLIKNLSCCAITDNESFSTEFQDEDDISNKLN